MKEATARTVIRQGRECDSSLRTLLDGEIAGRIHVCLHAAGVGRVN